MSDLDWKAVPDINGTWNKTVPVVFMLWYPVFFYIPILVKSGLVYRVRVTSELVHKVPWLALLPDLVHKQDSVVCHQLPYTHPPTILEKMVKIQ